MLKPSYILSFAVTHHVASYDFCVVEFSYHVLSLSLLSHQTSVNPDISIIPVLMII